MKILNITIIICIFLMIIVIVNQFLMYPYVDLVVLPMIICILILVLIGFLLNKNTSIYHIDYTTEQYRRIFSTDLVLINRVLVLVSVYFKINIINYHIDEPNQDLYWFDREKRIFMPKYTKYPYIILKRNRVAITYHLDDHHVYDNHDKILILPYITFGEYCTFTETLKSLLEGDIKYQSCIHGALVTTIMNNKFEIQNLEDHISELSNVYKKRSHFPTDLKVSNLTRYRLEDNVTGYQNLDAAGQLSKYLYCITDHGIIDIASITQSNINDILPTSNGILQHIKTHPSMYVLNYIYLSIVKKTKDGSNLFL